ncbi:MAG: hypothetical protein WC120_05315 [Parcubacteria group bacterium]|jgi:hypothetical protein
MRNDPYFCKARFAGTCPETGKPIRKGDEIAYFPRDRKAYHADSKAADQVREMMFNKCYGMDDANW